jgi:hypothetical protein
LATTGDRWHEQIGDPTVADGILDRLVHSAHRIEMRGDSMRKNRGKPKGGSILPARTDGEPRASEACPLPLSAVPLPDIVFVLTFAFSGRSRSHLRALKPSWDLSFAKPSAPF